MKILHVDSSITGARSVSRELSALIVAQLGGSEQHEVIYRDIVAEDLPHFTAVTAPSAHPISKAMPVLDEAQQANRDNSDAILKEFIEADTVVIGVPMYNFTLPSELKAWVDRIVIPGTTFKTGPNGPEGLAGDKRVILALARGGYYGEEAAFKAAEHAESFCARRWVSSASRPSRPSSPKGSTSPTLGRRLSRRHATPFARSRTIKLHWGPQQRFRAAERFRTCVLRLSALLATQRSCSPASGSDRPCRWQWSE